MCPHIIYRRDYIYHTLFYILRTKRGRKQLPYSIIKNKGRACEYLTLPRLNSKRVLLDMFGYKDERGKISIVILKEKPITQQTAT